MPLRLPCTGWRKRSFPGAVTRCGEAFHPTSDLTLPPNCAPLLVTCFPQPLRPPGKHTREASQSCSPAVPISSLDLPAFFQIFEGPLVRGTTLPSQGLGVRGSFCGPPFHTLTARGHLESPAPYLRSWKRLTDCVLSQKAIRAGLSPALPAEC